MIRTVGRVPAELENRDLFVAIAIALHHATHLLDMPETKKRMPSIGVGGISDLLWRDLGRRFVARCVESQKVVVRRSAGLVHPREVIQIGDRLGRHQAGRSKPAVMTSASGSTCLIAT